MLQTRTYGCRPSVSLREVDSDNWRACAALEVNDGQRDFVMPASYYLALCHYGRLWRPLAVYSGTDVVGFVMWAVDPSDNSGWLGALTIDRRHQGSGYGSAAVEAVLRMLKEEHGCTSAALSYSSANVRARRLYASLGFEETGELEDEELVARRPP
jgi:diamine N-acetyltransferase